MHRPDDRAGRRSDLRLSDAERDEAIVRLSDHYAAGRLDKDEFDERSDAVWTARTRSDLAPIFADLGPTDAERNRGGSASWARRGRRRFVPLLLAPLVVPVLVVLVVLTVLTRVPFILLAVVGSLFLFGGCRGPHWRRPQMRGSRF